MITRTPIYGHAWGVGVGASTAVQVLGVAHSFIIWVPDSIQEVCGVVAVPHENQRTIDLQPLQHTVASAQQIKGGH